MSDPLPCFWAPIPRDRRGCDHHKPLARGEGHRDRHELLWLDKSQTREQNHHWPTVNKLELGCDGHCTKSCELKSYGLIQSRESSPSSLLEAQSAKVQVSLVLDATIYALRWCHTDHWERHGRAERLRQTDTEAQ